MNTFNLDIKTPEKLIFSGNVESLMVEHPSGKEGYLANHEPVLRELAEGTVRFKPINNEDVPIDSTTDSSYKIEITDGVCQINISGGFISFLNNKAVVFIR